MKGIVFNLLEAVVVDAHGIDAWEDVLDTTGLDGSYTGVGQYPDDHLGALLDATAHRLGMARPELERWFGVEAFPRLAAAHPSFVADCDGTRRFLLQLDDVVHAEVQKLMPDAYLPGFACERVDDGSIVLVYTSRRRLCRFAEGLIVGVARHFGDDVSVRQSTCTHEGAPECRFAVAFR